MEAVFVCEILVLGVHEKLLPVPEAVKETVSPKQIVTSFPASIFPTSTVTLTLSPLVLVTAKSGALSLTSVSYTHLRAHET